MIKLCNCGPEAFKNRIKDKKIYIFGAGRALESCIDIYFERKKIELIVDNDSKLDGSFVDTEYGKVRIVGTSEFIKSIDKNNSILMITSPFYAGEIVNQLDNIKELDGLEVYLQVLVRNTKEKSTDFTFTNNNHVIPKKIHYIWIGSHNLPYEYEKNIDTWKKYNPEYEIVKWTEENYNFEKSEYMRRAYKMKAWGFVSNYARLDIINEYGGIYLDTDVEIISNFDCLINDEAFFNMGCYDRINMGCGFGAVSHNNILEQIIKEFDNSDFLKNKDIFIKRPFHTYVHPVLKKEGFIIKNEYQNIKGVVLYPREVMSPRNIEGLPDDYSNKTVSVHKESGTWKTEKEKEGNNQLLHIIRERINNSK